MNRLYLLTALTLVALTSCGATTLTTVGTAPLNVAAPGTCGAGPELIPSVDSLRIVRSWSGPATGRDSLMTVAGRAFSFPPRTVPEGVYTVTVLVGRRPAGRDTTIYSCAASLIKFIGSHTDTVRNMR